MAAKRKSSPPKKLLPIKALFWLNIVILAVGGVWFAFQPASRQQEVSRLLGNYLEREKRISLPDVAWDIYQLYYGKDFVSARLPESSDFFIGGQPEFPSTLRSLPNTAYAVGYDESLCNPIWAAYRVKDIDEITEAPPRPSNFSTDERTLSRIQSTDFNNSGYDRGHLAPNYAIAIRHGAKAQEETFLLSNIVPQKHALNAGLWRELEMRIATSYPARFGDVWVVAGPIFSARPQKLRRHVAIPDAFYMILTEENEGRLRTLAFIFPQDTPASGLLEKYLVSIDEIEARTGLDFFPALDTATQAHLESRKAARAW